MSKPDIRDKEARNIAAKEGVTTDKGKLKPENKEYVKELLNKINSYLE